MTQLYFMCWPNVLCVSALAAVIVLAIIKGIKRFQVSEQDTQQYGLPHSVSVILFISLSLSLCLSLTA